MTVFINFSILPVQVFSSEANWNPEWQEHSTASPVSVHFCEQGLSLEQLQAQLK